MYTGLFNLNLSSRSECFNLQFSSVMLNAIVTTAGSLRDSHSPFCITLFVWFPHPGSPFSSSPATSLTFYAMPADNFGCTLGDDNINQEHIEDTEKRLDGICNWSILNPVYYVLTIVLGFDTTDKRSYRFLRLAVLSWCVDECSEGRWDRAFVIESPETSVKSDTPDAKCKCRFMEWFEATHIFSHRI